MTSEVTSPAANVELVLAGFQAFNAGDLASSANYAWRAVRSRG
jgi:hypothetical protein